jgi:NAD(P)H-dependent FMN reductase
MGASGNLRHHAAVRAVLVELGAHNVRQHPAAAVAFAKHDGGGGLVAARLDAEDNERLPRMA